MPSQPPPAVPPCSRRLFNPRIELTTPAPADRLLPTLAAALRSAGFRPTTPPAHLAGPAVVAAARRDWWQLIDSFPDRSVVVGQASPDGTGTRLRVTVIRPDVSGTRARVTLALSDVVRRLAAAGVPVAIGEWERSETRFERRRRLRAAQQQARP